MLKEETISLFMPFFIIAQNLPQNVSYLDSLNVEALIDGSELVQIVDPLTKALSSTGSIIMKPTIYEIHNFYSCRVLEQINRAISQSHKLTGTLSLGGRLTLLKEDSFPVDYFGPSENSTPEFKESEYAYYVVPAFLKTKVDEVEGINRKMDDESSRANIMRTFKSLSGRISLFHEISLVTQAFHSPALPGTSVIDIVKKMKGVSKLTSIATE